MKRWLILLSVVCLVFAGAASASVQKGDTEIDALGGWLSENGKNNSGDVDVWFLSGRVGYFITDNIQVGGEALYASVDTGSTTKYYGLGAFGKYCFMPTNQWVPYVGGQVAWANVDPDGADSTDGVLWGPVVGARYELNATNDFFVEYQYHIWSGDAGDYIDDGHAILLGIVHQFK